MSTADRAGNQGMDDETRPHTIARPGSEPAIVLGPITRFRDRYFFLSSFYEAPVISPEDHLEYPTNEHAFQAAKSESMIDRMRIRGLPDPMDAKRAGRAISPIRADWEAVKRILMLRLNLEKFTAHEDLAGWLTDTGDRLLIEGNAWGDDYWGMVLRDGSWHGHNYLGQILMAVRTVL